MILAVYIANPQLSAHPEWTALLARLSSCDIYYVRDSSDIVPGTDFLLSVGGDGTFLSAARIVAGLDVPVIGVNLGRVGFLSENRPRDIADQLLGGKYVIEEREYLKAVVDGGEPQYAFNEVTVARKNAFLLGIDASVDGAALPTYWADGILVATSVGSTAYSLSIGGPICAPDSKVLIISPISPHNLNVRPLIVPSKSSIGISFKSREPELTMTTDNRSRIIPAGSRVDISVAQFSLKRVRFGQADFISALRSKLFWGEDVRNED